jgi:penicillin amidase/acyl-homoserine-lactone acylase
LITAEDRGEPAPNPIQAFAAQARRLSGAYGRVDVPWSRVNRLVRGRVDLGLGGGPDVLHAVYGEPVGARLVGRAGDSYVLVAEWGPEGVRSWSVHNYGSATGDPDSPHYADQAPLFASRRLKPVWLDEAEIRLHLEREYRPAREWAEPACCQGAGD